MPTQPSDPLPVFLEYVQAELDRAYDQRAWDPNMAQTIARYASLSEAARQQLGPPQTFAYGDTAAEQLDVYRAPAPHAPIHVFLHGGAWRSLSRHDSAFAAPGFVSAGANFVALDFALLPSSTLPSMVEEARRAIVWLYRNAATAFDGDPGRLHVSGHSSGAHMAACLLVTDWAAYGVPPNVIKSGVVVSGMYDLAPVRLSSRNDYVRLTAETEAALSPLHHIRRLGCPVTVCCGTTESPEFLRQGQHFARFCQFSRHLDPVGLWAGRAAYAACIMPSATPAALVKRERRRWRKQAGCDDDGNGADHGVRRALCKNAWRRHLI